MVQRLGADAAVAGRDLWQDRPARGPHVARHQAFWRLHPERWLESLVVRDVNTIDEHLDHGCLYSQVPAFSASDCAMLDVLTITRANRLTGGGTESG